jgi:hypothetical protein
VSFACEIDGVQLKEVEDTLVYCYLPTKAKWGFKFLMNTDMIPTGPRDDVVIDFEDQININAEISEIAGKKFFDWIKCLCDMKKYKLNSIFNLIPVFDTCIKEHGKYKGLIERFKIGYTLREEDDKMKKYSYRVIIPSYNSIGELNYWVGRDYLPKNPKFERTKYSNPKAEKKEIIFNEDRIQWDADITLVEGAFDHIVVPNSIPLLGKALDKDYKLYWDIITKANAKVNIFLDGDAYGTVKEIYKLLNHGRLYDKVRYIPVGEKDDPSSLYQDGGYKKIAEHLANAQQIKEVYLY